MLDSIRSASSAVYLPLDPKKEAAADRPVVPGSERPISPRAVHAANQTDPVGPDPRAARADAPRDTGSDTGRTERGAERARAGDDEGSDGGTDTEQSTQEALKDPNSAESQQVRELSARDREVRAHEQAHLVAAGPYSTYGPNYNYQTGPDGRRYAIGGEVGIDTAVVPDDPQATLAKMQVVQRAALAPAEPSTQDMRVAADAAQKAAQARMAIMKEHFEARAQPVEGDDTANEDSEADAIAGNTPADLGHQARQAVDAYGAADTDTGELIDLAA
ncbi:MAG: putative metalloprotease CJM1_0395 family protein [Pseudomonadota bacterium]